MLTKEQIRQRQNEIKSLRSTVATWKPKLEVIGKAAVSTPNF